jgi:hypothetical protein
MSVKIGVIFEKGGVFKNLPETSKYISQLQSVPQNGDIITFIGSDYQENDEGIGTVKHKIYGHCGNDVSVFIE